MWDEEFFWDSICEGELVLQESLELCLMLGVDSAFSLQETPSADEAEFGEWPHVCALLKKEEIGAGVRQELF